MMHHGIANVRFFPSERNCNQVGIRIFRKLTDLPGHAERLCAGDCGHFQDVFRRNAIVSASERLHLGKQTQFDFLLFAFADGGEAVGSKAKVRARAGKLFVRERRMPEIFVAARTMDNVCVPFPSNSASPGARQLTWMARKFVPVSPARSMCWTANRGRSRPCRGHFAGASGTFRRRHP